MTTLSLLRECARHGATRATKHWKALAGASVAYGFTLVVPDLLGHILDPKSDYFYLIGVAFAFLNVSFGIGMARMARLLEDGKPASWTLLFSYTAYILPLLGLTLVFIALLLGLWLIAGMLQPAAPSGDSFKSWNSLLPIAGILGGAYVYVRVSFFAYALAADDTGITAWEALKRSFRATRGWFWFSVVLGIGEILAYGLGIAALGIGLLWVIPFTLFASNHAYARIRSSHGLTSAGA